MKSSIECTILCFDLTTWAKIHTSTYLPFLFIPILFTHITAKEINEQINKTPLQMNSQTFYLQQLFSWFMLGIDR